MMISIDSVNITVAMASAPSFATQNTSATANTDSIAISRTIGTASSRIARPSGSDVKSWRAPRNDSRTSAQKPPRLGAAISGDRVVAAAALSDIGRAPYRDDEPQASGSTPCDEKVTAGTGRTPHPSPRRAPRGEGTGPEERDRI